MIKIRNSNELLYRMKGINSWIENNKENIGNANMYEIMSCMIARNNIRILEGENNELLDAEVEKMISLRSDSIDEFQQDVPESKALFEAVRKGLTGNSIKEMELMCKCQSVPFFTNNTRKRGFDGDIKMSEEEQRKRAIPTFYHDNFQEVANMASSYDEASDEVRSATFEALNWLVNNCVDELKNMIALTPVFDKDPTHSK